MSTWAFYPLEEIQYPDSDGKPVAESDFQFYPLIYAAAALRRYFQDRDDVYVASNLFLYYEEGNPKAVVAPEILGAAGSAVGSLRALRRSAMVGSDYFSGV